MTNTIPVRLLGSVDQLVHNGVAALCKTCYCLFGIANVSVEKTTGGLVVSYMYCEFISPCCWTGGEAIMYLFVNMNFRVEHSDS